MCTIIHYVPYRDALNQSLKLLCIDSLICLQENDADWNISWPFAARGKVAIQKCPGGTESIGT